MKWHFSNRGNSTRQVISCDIRVRLKTIPDLAFAYNMYIPADTVKKIDNPSSFLCFGIGDEGVFLTTQPLGQKFKLTGKNRAGAQQINGKELVCEIFDYFNIDHRKPSNYVLDLNLQKVDTDIWQLVKAETPEKSKWGWK